MIRHSPGCWNHKVEQIDKAVYLLHSGNIIILVPDYMTLGAQYRKSQRTQNGPFGNAIGKSAIHSSEILWSTSIH